MREKGVYHKEKTQPKIWIFILQRVIKKRETLPWGDIWNQRSVLSEKTLPSNWSCRGLKVPPPPKISST